MFKNLKSLFFTEDEDPKKEAAKAEATAKEAPVKKEQPATKSSQPVSTRPPTAEKGKITEKFTDILFGAMEKNNLDGFDYLEFKQSLQSLSKMPMDEKTRFQSAFAMAQTMKATPDHLIETAGHYIKILKQEEERFGQALTNQRSKQIGDREQKTKDLQGIINNKKEQIKKLTEDIANHEKHLEQLSGEISQSTVKVQNTQNNFMASYNAIVAQIMADVESMKKYLK